MVEYIEDELASMARKEAFEEHLAGIRTCNQQLKRRIVKKRWKTRASDLDATLSQLRQLAGPQRRHDSTSD